MTALELLGCGALIGCSAFLSASEVALFSLSRFHLRSLRDRFKEAHRTIRKLKSDPGGVLITILVLNEVVNIALSTLVTGVIDRLMPGTSWSWAAKTAVGILVTTPIVLILCEITPKTIGVKANTLIAPITARGLHALYSLMKPVRVLITRLVRFIARSKGGAMVHGDSSAPIKESDFLVMAEEGQKEGAIHRNELELIRNVFKLDNTEVHELMTPIAQVPTVNESMTIQQAIQQIRQTKLPRVPVYSKDRRKIVGILYMKDLLRARLNPALGQSEVAEIMEKPMIVPRQMPANRLFKRFRQTKTHIAIIESPSGDPIGILTLDQILDELLEELIYGRESSTAGGTAR